MKQMKNFCVFAAALGMVFGGIGLASVFTDRKPHRFWAALSCFAARRLSWHTAFCSVSPRVQSPENNWTGASKPTAWHGSLLMTEMKISGGKRPKQKKTRKPTTPAYLPNWNNGKGWNTCFFRQTAKGSVRQGWKTARGYGSVRFQAVSKESGWRACWNCRRNAAKSAPLCEEAGFLKTLRNIFLKRRNAERQCKFFFTQRAFAFKMV